ncbi:hypothetical protein [Pedobacter montanisoli]|uniref:DUF1795 domain-containing protein n=1 Tax=Pedobacter montanisoli TaxID=2923277 RepID=A0ABS9ZXY4_9SPHI|nr:hypothetical protein [Pedobacter montanisoli]MCJ0743153.1 hypothetical protein [Pedobacter montanisoli]
MKKLSTRNISLILFFLCLSSITNAQDGWFKQKISNRITVSFPTEPKKINETSFGLNQDDIIYATSFVDLLKVTSLSLEAFNKSVISQEYADEFLEGLAPSFPKYVFEKPKIYNFQSCTSYTIYGKDSVNRSTIHINIVFVDGIAYTVGCILPENKDSKLKDLFLANINISK